MPPIDWEQLSLTLGTLRRVDGRTHEHVSGRDAQLAIASLIGDDEIRATVRYYIDGGPGAELARFVLWKLRPPAAMAECYREFQNSSDSSRRTAAVELLRVVADKSALAWVPGFLQDSNPEVQLWGIGLVDQLLQDGLADADEVESIVKTGETHANPIVVEQAASIRSIHGI